MRYFFWTGCAVIVTGLAIHIRRRNALLRYLREANLNDRGLRTTSEGGVNRTSEDNYISSM